MFMFTFFVRNNELVCLILEPRDGWWSDDLCVNLCICVSGVVRDRWRRPHLYLCVFVSVRVLVLACICWCVVVCWCVGVLVLERVDR